MKKMRDFKKRILILSQVLFLVPILAKAQTFASLTNSWVGFLNKVVAVLGSIAFLFFMWGGAMVILGSGDTGKVKEGKQRMIWSLVGLFVMFSVWGLLSFMNGTIFGGASGGAAGPAPGSVPTGLGPR